MVTSKERHLWLHFHSDESIEYSGFMAVYDYIPRPTSCKHKYILSAIFLRSYIFMIY